MESDELTIVFTWSLVEANLCNERFEWAKNAIRIGAGQQPHPRLPAFLCVEGEYEKDYRRVGAQSMLQRFSFSLAAISLFSRGNTDRHRWKSVGDARVGCRAGRGQFLTERFDGAWIVNSPASMFRILHLHRKHWYHICLPNRNQMNERIIIVSPLLDARNMFSSLRTGCPVNAGTIDWPVYVVRDAFRRVFFLGVPWDINLQCEDRACWLRTTNRFFVPSAAVLMRMACILESIISSSNSCWLRCHKYASTCRFSRWQLNEDELSARQTAQERFTR